MPSPATSTDRSHEGADSNSTVSSGPTLLWLSVAVVLLAGLISAGYLASFSSFAIYDDEGYVMISLQSYQEGNALYDQTYTQYGPAFFQVSGLLHNILKLPITHDIVRFKTLAMWLLSSILAGIVVWRMISPSESRLAKWLALITVPLVFFHLDRFGLEAGHPQEICVLLMMLCLLIATWLGR